MVYGTTWKELIQEEFERRIMSAIDFDMTMERQPDPKGDRVKIACRASSWLQDLLEHDGFGWNQPNPSCPVEPRSPVRANGMRWNAAVHLIPFRL